jgi:hypothetical protein
MRVLLAAAVSLATAAVSAAGAAGPHAVNLVSMDSGTISAFAQDGPLIAWFTPDPKHCNTVHVRSLANGLHAELPKQAGARNVTCRWAVGQSPVSLAVAAKTSDVLWTLRASSPLEFDYLVGAGTGGAGDEHERRFQELAHTNRGAGLWFGGVVGNGTTLAYGVTSVDYEDEAGCLAGTAPCAMKIAGGGVYRVVGRQPPKLIPGTSPAVAVAASDGRIAYVETGAITKEGKPVAGADATIEVVDALSGRVASSIRPVGTPIAIALAPHVLATLEKTHLGLRLAWYALASSSRTATGSVPVAVATTPALTASDQLVVFHVGRSIRAVEIATGRVRSLVTAGAPPLGLSIEGSRLAWAENRKHGARIRAYYVTGRG